MWPNPLVGAVIVRDGIIVAEGYHAVYGDRHAEAVALTAAGISAQGATLYCNLEPCCYSSPTKHQPPCTVPIIRCGISRVVIGQLDPNPHVRGRGLRILREAGIEVIMATSAALMKEILELNKDYNGQPTRLLTKTAPVRLS